MKYTVEKKNNNNRSSKNSHNSKTSVLGIEVQIAALVIITWNCCDFT